MFNLSDYIAFRFTAGYGSVWLVGDETHEYLTQIRQAAEDVTAQTVQRHKDADEAANEDDLRVRVVSHDKLSGFHTGLASLDTPHPKTVPALAALRCAMWSDKQIKAAFPEIKFPGEDAGPTDYSLPFHPAEDLIFVFKDIDFEIRNNAQVVQAIRNITSSNMANGEYAANAGQGNRGQRMLVLITTGTSIPNCPPELKPKIVPLPNDDVLLTAAKAVIDPLVSLGRIPEPSKEDWDRLTRALRGFTYQRAEDVVSLALAQHKSLSDLDVFLKTIEEEKANYLEEIAGIKYISRESLPQQTLPGYEYLERAIKKYRSIGKEVAAKYNIPDRFKGAALAGGPGVGKTVTALQCGMHLNTMLLLMNLGEVQQGIVGESEKMMRRALQAAEAMSACLVLDDVDKAGIGAASQGTTGDSGVFGRIVNMLLTELSRPDAKASYIFTFNRTAGIPPELLRKGRLKELLFVQRPNSATREAIFNFHLSKHGVTADNEAQLRLLADDVTDEWTGAEIEDLVEDGVIEAATTNASIVSVTWMIDEARRRTPLAKMTVFSDDIRKMESDCAQFTKIGNINQADQPAQASGTRKRETRI